MRKISHYIANLASFFLVAVLFLSPNPYSLKPAYAQVPGEWTGLIPGKPDWCVMTMNETEVATIQGFECLFINVVRILIPLVGLAFFIMLVAGSFQFITAGGEAKALQKARASITSALFGLIAFFGVWFILRLIQTITGVDVLNFMIPGP